jgi:adenylyl-sulfate kinase
MTENIKFQQYELSQYSRSKIKKQKPLCLWMTGLSGSGKSTLSNALEVRLNELGKHTYVLDGDNLRFGLNSDLGFSVLDRNENVRRSAEVASLMVDAGLIVIVGLISPLEDERKWARGIFKPGQFKEIFLSTSLKDCEKRDVKGLYKKARNGIIKDFTGIDSPYEVPTNPDITIDTVGQSVNECINYIVKELNLS